MLTVLQIEAVAKEFGVPARSLFGPVRGRNLTDVRRTIFWILALQRMTHEEIAEIFHVKRDIVTYHMRLMNNELKNDPVFNSRVTKMQERILG